MTEVKTGSAGDLAHTLRWLADNGYVPGLLPDKVRSAADLLEKQDLELKEARQALAAKDHIVTARVTDGHFTKAISARFVIADPRVYEGSVILDYRVADADGRYVHHIIRSLVSKATAAWLDDLRERALVAVLKALQAQADRNPKGHDPAEGHGRNDESPVAATSGDAPEGS